MTQITYPNGGERNYTYDGQNRIATQDDGSGVHELTYTYESTRTIITDALNHSTIYEFTSERGLKRVTKRTDPDGKITLYTYDSNFNLASETDPLNHSTQYTYDSRGNVTDTENAAGGHTLASYEPVFNKPTSITDPRTYTTNMEYDGEGNLTEVTDPLTHTTIKGYDAQGHMTSDKNPLNQQTNYTYKTSNGALETITDPLSRVTEIETDALSRVTKQTDPEDKETDYEYDSAGNLTKVTDALNGETEYAYVAGREKKLLDTVTDALNHNTSFDYDPQGRLTSVTNHLSQTRTTEYDDKGNVVETVNARSQTITYEYDENDRLKKKDLPEGDIDYDYDDAGRLTDVQSWNGSRIQNTYDSLNRVTQVIQTLPGGHSVTIGYGYDANGNRTSMTTPWGNFSYTYDAANRLTQITNPQSKVFGFSYDNANRRTQLTYPNGIQADYVYDAAGQVTSIIHKRTSDNYIIAKATYAYDDAGNRTSMTDLAGTHTYVYDDLHRLTEAHHPAGSSLPIKNESFSYDAVGNRLADAAISSYTYNAVNRMLSNSSFTYTYDADGNLLTQVDTMSVTQLDLDFDSENRLIQADMPGSIRGIYKYDPQGRRVERSTGPVSGQVVTKYIYDGPNILATLDGGNSLRVIYTNGLQIDEPLMMRAGSTDYFYHQNALSSVIALSNSSSGTVETVEYQAYGHAVIKDSAQTYSTSTVGNSLLFTGREWDHERGQVFYRSRQAYDPITGRFGQEDPNRTSGDEVNIDGAGKPLVSDAEHGSTNLYQYAYNSPLTYNDPLGLDPDPRKLKKPAAKPAFCPVDPSRGQDACIKSCMANRFGAAALVGGAALEILGFGGASYTVWSSQDIVRGTITGMRIAPAVGPAVAGSFLVGYSAGTFGSCAVECTYARGVRNAN